MRPREQAGNIALTPAPVSGELVTPTGAAIVAALRTSDQLPSRYSIEAVGYGAGKRPYEGSNALAARPEVVEDMLDLYERIIERCAIVVEGVGADVAHELG